MIVLFTDFGLNGPYIGQMKAVLYQRAPSVPVVDLFADAPRFNPRASAHLLHAYHARFPRDSVFLCVVDPGVGGPRRPIVIEAEGQRFVGPDNGLFHRLVASAYEPRAWVIREDVGSLSASFHGRDLFAPVAASLAIGKEVALEPIGLSDLVGASWPQLLAEVVYIDHYGNAMTGIGASELSQTARLQVQGQELAYARTFGDVPVNGLFWYYNSNDLVEIAQNRGNAALSLNLEIGTEIRLIR